MKPPGGTRRRCTAVADAVALGTAEDNAVGIGLESLIGGGVGARFHILDVSRVGIDANDDPMFASDGDFA